MSISNKIWLTLFISILTNFKLLLCTKLEALNLMRLWNQKESPFSFSILHALDTMQSPLPYFSIVR